MKQSAQNLLTANAIWHAAMRAQRHRSLISEISVCATKGTESGKQQMSHESIEDVITRCRARIALLLDIKISDVERLIEEVEKHKHAAKIQRPVWYDLGTGD